MNVIIAGETLQLLPQRALLWPAQRMLVVADIHFGKAAAFRAQGVPVPRGTTTQNLMQLDALLALHDVSRVTFLGDFLHARTSHAAATLARLREWRVRHPLLALTLVRGNHDERAGDPPPDLRIEMVDEPFRLGPFAMCHHPQTLAGCHVLAGHLHPVYRVTTRTDSLRLPCFVSAADCTVLPSFGAFTGGYPVQPDDDERIYVTTGETIFEIP